MSFLNNPTAAPQGPVDPTTAPATAAPSWFDRHSTITSLLSMADPNIAHYFGTKEAQKTETAYRNAELKRQIDADAEKKKMDADLMVQHADAHEKQQDERRDLALKALGAGGSTNNKDTIELIKSNPNVDVTPAQDEVVAKSAGGFGAPALTPQPPMQATGMGVPAALAANPQDQPTQPDTPFSTVTKPAALAMATYRGAPEEREKADFIESLNPTSPKYVTRSPAQLDALGQKYGIKLSDKVLGVKDAEHSAIYKEWQDAKVEGFKGTFAQYETEDANRKLPKTPTVDQNKLEQQYRTVLQRAMSSRSGGIGLEDQKVQQANHLLSLMNQNYDSKTDNYNIPTVQLNELALGLARLVSPGGQVGEGMMKELNQATATGDVAKVLTYLTGTPVTGSTQDVFKMFKHSIERQGMVAQENREGEMRYLRGLAPTELEEERRKKLEANNLNPLRQSRVIQNPKTGERRLQESIDGGATWK